MGDSFPSRRFLLLVRHDFYAGTVLAWKKYFPVILLFAAMCAYFLQSVSSAEINDQIHSRPDFADYLIDVFRGMRIYHPGGESVEFQAPAAWLMLHSYLAYLVSDYPFRDLCGFGQQVLLRSKLRGQWWYCKCVWVSGSVVLCYLLGYLTLLLFSLCTGGISLVPHRAINLSVSQVDSSKLTPGCILAVGILLPVLTSIALSLFQTFLSFYSNPVFGYSVIIGILVVSAFQCSPLLPGNYLMLLRSVCVTPQGVTVEDGILADLCFIVFSVLAGAGRFSRYDILKKQNAFH